MKTQKSKKSLSASSASFGTKSASSHMVMDELDKYENQSVHSSQQSVNENSYIPPPNYINTIKPSISDSRLPTTQQMQKQLAELQD